MKKGGRQGGRPEGGRGLLVTAGGPLMERSLIPIILLWKTHSVADTVRIRRA